MKTSSCFRYGIYSNQDQAVIMFHLEKEIESSDPVCYRYQVSPLFLIDGPLRFLPHKFFIISKTELLPETYTAELTFFNSNTAKIVNLCNAKDYEFFKYMLFSQLKKELSYNAFRSLQRNYSIEKIVSEALVNKNCFEVIFNKADRVKARKIIINAYIEQRLLCYTYSFNIYDRLAKIGNDVFTNKLSLKQLLSNSYSLIRYNIPFKKTDYIASISGVQANSELRYAEILKQEFLTAFEQNKMFAIRGNQLGDYIFNSSWLKNNSGFYRKSDAVFNSEVARQVFSKLMQQGSIHAYSIENKEELNCSFEQYLADIESDKLHADLVYFSCDELYIEQQRFITKLATFANRSNNKVLSLVEVKLGIDLYEKEHHIKFNESQKQALIHMFDDNKFALIVGKAGTGKTTVIKAFIEIHDKMSGHWNEQTIKDCYDKAQKKHPNSNVEIVQVAVMAYTGRAASAYSKIVQYNTNTANNSDHYQYMHAGTIHSSMSFSYKGDTGKKKSNFLIADYIIIDEASMLDFTLMHRLVNHLSYKGKIILVGDPNQVAPIHAGQIFYDLLKTPNLHNSVVKLDHVYRQADQSKITKLTEQILHSEKYEQPTTGSGNVEFQHTTDVKKALSIVQNYILDRSTELKDTILLTAEKNTPMGTLALNHTVQNLLHTDSEDTVTNENGTVFCNGDRVIQTKNDYELRIPAMNGQLGTLYMTESNSGALKTDNGVTVQIFVLFDDGTKKLITSMDKLNNLDLGYAITVHKAQGLEKKSVMLVLDPAQYRMWNRNILYTGITRTKQNLFLIGSDFVYNKALHTIDNHIDREFVQKLNDKILELNPLHVTQAEIDTLPF